MSIHLHDFDYQHVDYGDITRLNDSMITVKPYKGTTHGEMEGGRLIGSPLE